MRPLNFLSKVKRIKYFTPQEANKTLPLVKRIVKDILLTGNQLRNFHEANPQISIIPQKIESLEKNLEALFKELESIGCYYKDWNYEIGLIDFPAIIDDQEVWLCWKSDEEVLQYYHSVEEGFAGRKIIPERLLVSS